MPIDKRKRVTEIMNRLTVADLAHVDIERRMIEEEKRRIFPRTVKKDMTERDKLEHFDWCREHEQLLHELGLR